MRDRDAISRPQINSLQLFAVASLIGHCEALAASGDLNQSQEASLRYLVAQTLAAFAMPSKCERRALEPFPGSETGAYAP